MFYGLLYVGNVNISCVTPPRCCFFGAEDLSTVIAARNDVIKRTTYFKESTSKPGFSFTWRMRLPLPSNKPAGSCSTAPLKKPTLT